MHALLGALASVLLVVGLAAAADDKPAHSSHTQRMKECSAEAGDKHLVGDARTQFVSECLKGQAGHGDSLQVDKGSHSRKAKDGEHHNPQGEKMKACNQEASGKSLHGDDRRAFMSECLRGDKKS
jgi:psiF repeat